LSRAVWRKTNRIIVYGIHSQAWIDALNPKGLVWSKVFNCSQVISIPDEPKMLPKKSFRYRDVLIPLMESHIRNVPSRSLGIRPDSNALEILENKRLFAEFMQSYSLHTYIPRHYKIEDSFEFPIILKRVNLNAGHGILKIHSYAELEQILKSDFWVNQEYVLQEHVEGLDEFTFHCVYKNGIRLWGTCIKYTFDNHEVFPLPTNILETKRVSINSGLLAKFDETLSALNYSGPCNIGFKLQDSNLKILEINPRLGGSLMRPENVDLLADCLRVMINAA
jgi:predicted ATP-grasp superfamily ATP-dependent carboligase